MSTPGQRSAYIMDARQDSVYISYAHQDHEWHNRIATQLANAGISILDHPPTTREDLKASRREQAQVFVLLLSSHYFNSDEILKIELPHIRSLSQAQSRQAIAAIIAPCEWQSYLGRHEFLVIPEDGRAIAEGNPEQIKDDLHTLTRQVRDAIRAVGTEATSPQREENPTTIPPRQTPSVPESLALRLAAKLTIEMASGKYEAMATLISPTMALTTFNVISRSGFLRQKNPKISIRSLGTQWPPIQAALTAQNEAVNFAVLELASPVPFVVPSDPFLAPPFLPARAEWRSYFASAGKENGSFVSGSIELEKDNSSRLRLDWPQPIAVPSFPSINGAPVIVGAQLFGIVTDGLSPSKELYVVTIEAMAKSKEGSAIRSLLHNAPATAPDTLEVSFVEAPKQPTAVSPDQLPGRVIAGFQSDVASGDDLLGITQEVESICSVLAAKDVEPPVSIGLFGDWGSGKTFFMKQMEKEFKFIERGAQTAKGETAYCSNIVQLWFNAWHYVDANLWASLVSHIFEGLADYVSPQTDDQQARSRLLSELQTTKELRAQAEREKEGAVRQREETEKALTQLAEKRAQTEAKLTDLRLPDLQRLLETDTQLKKELEESLESLGFPAAMNSLTSLDAALEDAHGLAGRLRTALLSLWQSKNRKSQILLLVLVLVGFPLLVWLLKFWLPNQWLFTSVGTAWGELSVLVISLTATLNKYVRKGSEYLSRFERARQNVAALLERKKQEKSDRELQLEKDLHEIKAKEAGTSKQFSDAQAKVREIEERIKEIDEGRNLSKFLLERVQADDYRKYLGIISSVRRDFEMLNRLWPRGSDGGSNQTLRPIDRIILYIDDLDRCPERTVVEVLQAIHLLLFFPLFVVVVGVDSRWLLHSLRQRSRVFQDAAEAKGQLSGMERNHWQTTPLNYLEKIFQIPYAVRPMQQDGFQRLMNNLTEHKDWPKQGQNEDLPTSHEEQSKQTQDVSVSDTPASAPASGLASATGASVVQASSPPGEPTIIRRTVPMRRFDPSPKRLQLEERERQFALRLYGLIPSPRAAKRFVNVYRLLRTSIEEEELEGFLSKDETGEYQAVQLLLAIQSGYPEQAVQIIDDLIKQAPQAAWWEFIQEYESRAIDTRGTAPRAGDVGGGKRPKPGITQRVEAERWRDLLDRLSVLSEAVLVGTSCAVFLKWAPRVARYSFQSARRAAPP